MGENNLTNLIINYLPQTLTDEDFRSMFLTIGPIKSSKIVREKTTNYSYGFGFVDYDSPEDAQRAIRTLDGLSIENKKLKVALARPSGENTKGANLYIRNVPKHYKEEDLEALFKDFGQIVQSRVLIDLQTGESKGVGFVLFSKKAEAEAAIAGMNGHCPPDSPTPFVVKFADENSKNQSHHQNFIQQQQTRGMNYTGLLSQGGPMRNTTGNRMRFNPMGGANMNSYSGPNNYDQAGFGGAHSYGGYSAGIGAHNYNSTPAVGMSGHMNSSGHIAEGGGFILYAYNIGYDCTEAMLMDLFSNYGTVQRVNVIYDHQRGQCKGYGFVTMTNFREAQNAISSLNESNFNGRIISVSFKSNKK